MKRITLATAVFSISLLAVWAIFQTSSASLVQTKINHPEIQGHSLENEKSKAGTSGKMAIPVTGAERKVTPAFDTSDVK